MGSITIVSCSAHLISLMTDEADITGRPLLSVKQTVGGGEKKLQSDVIERV